MKPPVMVAYGGGVNSTALLTGCVERGITINACLFADTGGRQISPDGLGEKPSTYAFIWRFAGWLAEHGIDLQIVCKRGMYESLEDNCLKKAMLPSRAYGFSSCSEKWKHQPQEYWANHWEPAQRAWAAGQKVIKYIGIDAGEAHRAQIREDDKYIYEYPLIDWNWGRKECVEAIKHVGLPVPPLSACWFCPSSTKAEVLALARDYPHLYQRAIAMEQRAASTLLTVEGLGRHWSWQQLVEANERQRELFPQPAERTCMCYDGE